MDGIAESAAVSVKTIYRLFAKLLQLGVFYAKAHLVRQHRQKLTSTPGFLRGKNDPKQVLNQFTKLSGALGN